MSLSHGGGCDAGKRYNIGLIASSSYRVTPLRPRIVYFATFAACAGLIGFGLFLQHGGGLEPCPMCIIQRYAFVVCALIALAAALHNPRNWGSRIYAGLMLLSALGGGSVAARQSWLQRNPPAVPSCGPDLDFMLDSFPLTQALPMIFRGTGDCAEIKWVFLGLSIPDWALLCFLAIAAVAIWLAAAKAPLSR